MNKKTFTDAISAQNAPRKYTYEDMKRAQKAVEKAEQDLQDAKQLVLRAKKRMLKETEKTEYATSEVGYAQGQVWRAKAIFSRRKSPFNFSKEEHMKFVIDNRGRERLDFMYVHPDAIAFFARYHLPAVYQVETSCFKIPDAAQRTFIRNFEQRHDCTIYFVIEQHFPFPKESDDIHPTTAFLFSPMTLFGVIVVT